MLKVAVTDYTFADLSVEKEILEPDGKTLQIYWIQIHS